ncbi:MAG TPA: hypothetical protein VN608_09440 [Clostridia bacterium]|nr:hypothetical protein [Clostridia bacterium]
MRKPAKAADETGCAVILVGHLNKMQSSKGIQRMLGSIDIAAVARREPAAPDAHIAEGGLNPSAAAAPEPPTTLYK